MAKKKAQASMEFMILMGFLTFVIIGIVSTGYYYSNTIADRMQIGQVSNFANKITSTAEVVFYAGEPSKSTISVNLPDRISEIEIINNQIIITHTTTTGINKISYTSKVPMVENQSAKISTYSGIKNIIIVANSTHAIVSQK